MVVIPLTVHTSYGYVFNRDISSLDEVQEDFDHFLTQEGVSEFEQRAVIPFPNFVHRRIYDGAVARIGNAASFIEPLEATAIRFTQLQVSLILHMRFTRPAEFLEADAPVVNRFLVNDSLGAGLFVGWHYSCGSMYDSPFWRYARDCAWPGYREAATDPSGEANTALTRFEGMLELINETTIDESDWKRQLAFLPLSSFAQMAQGLGWPIGTRTGAGRA